LIKINVGNRIDSFIPLILHMLYYWSSLTAPDRESSEVFTKAGTTGIEDTNPCAVYRRRT